MNHYDKNMECIKKNKKYLYNSIKEADISSTSNRLEEIHSVKTKNDEKAILIRFHSTEYKLNSTYNPIEEAKKWIEQYKFHNYKNVISMFGLGNGIFAKTIIEKMGENDTFLIYEPCADIFFHVLNNYDLTDILENNRVSIALEKINEFEFHNVLRRTMNITNMSTQIMCVYPQYDNIFTESCVLFWKELKDAYSHTKININTEIVFGKRFIENTLNNVKFLRGSNTLSELKNELAKNSPAIIVAGGPSVEKQIEELKRAKGKALIFAVDRILDYLLDEGVEPDFVVTLDPMKPVKYFSRRTNIKIPLLCFLEANHEILERHVGKKIICNCTGFLEKVYKDAKKLPPSTISSASVATLTFSACIELGFTKIILVGQDLAYDGGYSHAGGVAEKNVPQREVMLEDINGKQIKSRYDWKEFVIWYQDMLTINPKLEVIDAKEKGAKIKGTTVMPLREAIDKYCGEMAVSGENIQQMEPTFNTEELNNIKEYLTKNLSILKKIKGKSKDAIETCNTLINESKKNSTNSHTEIDAFKKLTKINNYIGKQSIYTIMDSFITVTAAQHILEIFHFTDDIKENSLKTYEKSKCVFEAIIEAVDYIKPKLEKAIDNVI